MVVHVAMALEKTILVHLPDINTLPQLLSQISIDCESEYFKLLHLGYNE